MLKESLQVIRHYRTFCNLINVRRMLICSLVLMAVFGVLYRVANVFEMIYLFHMSSVVAMITTVIAFVLSCVKNHLENVCIQCGDNCKITDFSCDELFETLQLDKKIHEEVMEYYQEEIDKDCEMSRYIGIRIAHFAVWYAKNMKKVSDFCKSLEYKDEVLVERFKEEQIKYFDFIAEMFSEGVVQTNIVRQGEKLVYERLDSMRAFISE